MLKDYEISSVIQKNHTSNKIMLGVTLQTKLMIILDKVVLQSSIACSVSWSEFNRERVILFEKFSNRNNQIKDKSDLWEQAKNIFYLDQMMK